MLTRRSSLLLPLLLAACGGGEEQRTEFPPLHYSYLLPLLLNVAAIEIQQRFIPSGKPPDVSQLDPMPPVVALHNMAEDRLQALGSSGKAVFIIQDASLERHDDTVTGNFAVELDIFTMASAPAAFARANVTSTYTGELDDLRGRLYDMTKTMMDRMNVEFEYQVRKALGRWLLAPGATQPPVEQVPLAPSPPPAPLRSAP